MLDPVKRERFQELRSKEAEGALAPGEHDELSALIQEMEQAEAAYLEPAAERLARKCELLEAQNQALAALLARKRALRERLETLLGEAQTERRAIDEEVARIFGEHARAEPLSKN